MSADSRDPAGMAFVERYLRTPGVVEIGGRPIKRYHVNVDGAEPDFAGHLVPEGPVAL